MTTLGRLAACLAAALALTSCSLLPGTGQSTTAPFTVPSASVPAQSPATSPSEAPTASETPTLTPTPTPTPARPAVADVTLATLTTAEVPANCELPAQRLVNGKTTKGSPGEGGLVLDQGRYAFVDLAGLGYKQGLVAYGCNAGGVGWPEHLLLIGDGGRLLASYDLGKVDKKQHATVTGITAGNPVRMRWSAYEGAGFDIVDHDSTVTFSGGKLQVVNAASNTLTVTKGTADFASPTGGLICGIDASGVRCAATVGALKTAPKSSTFCGGDLDANTIVIEKGKASWACYGGIPAYPVKDSQSTSWQHGFGTWANPASNPFGGQQLAVLPYGKSLIAGTYRCDMAQTGVTCRSTATGKGFQLRRAGVRFF